MLFQSYIGLDIRNNKFNIVILKSSYRNTQLVEYTTFDYASGLNTNQKVKIIGDVIGERIGKHRLAEPEIYLSVPRERVIVREAQLPLATKENLRATLGYEMQKYVPLPESEIYFDYLIVDENKNDGTIRLLLFVIKKSDLDEYLSLADVLGYDLSNVQITSTAISSFLRTHPQGDTRHWIGIIRYGHDFVEGCLYHPNSLVCTQHLQISDAGKPLDTIPDIIKNLEAHRDTDGQAVRWYQVRESRDAPAVERFGETSGPIPPLNLAATPIDNAGAEMICAYSLAVQGARSVLSDINLIPERRRRKPSRVAYYTMLVLAALILIAGLSWGVSGIMHRQMEMSAIDGELARLQTAIAENEKLTSQTQETERQVAAIMTLKNSRTPVLAILEELSDRIPATAWIQNFRLQNKQIQISGFSADSASALLVLLEDSPLLKDVFFVSAIVRKDDGSEQFRIGMTVE